MASASTRYGGDRLSRGDDAGEVRAIWTAAAITISTTILAAAGAALVAPVIVRGFFHLSGPLETAGSLALRILCVVAVLQAITGTLNTPQVVRLRWRSLTLVTQGTAILQIIALPIALALTNGGLVTVSAVVIATAALATVGTVWVARRLQPKLLPPKVDPRLVYTLLTYGGALTISGIATIPLTTAERLLLGHFASTSVVAYYAVAARLGALISVVPAAVAVPLFPALIALLDSSDDRTAANTLFRQALKGSFLFLTPVAILLALIAHPFLSVWAGATYGRHSTQLFYIVLVGVWFNSLALNAVSYLAAIDRPGVLARVHALEVLPYIGVAALLSAKLGGLGAALAWSIRVVIDAVLLFWSAKRAGGVSLSPLSARTWASAGAPLMLAAIALPVGVATSSLGVRLAFAVGLGIAYAAVAWRFVLSAQEQRGLVRLTAEVMPTLLRRR